MKRDATHWQQRYVDRDLPWDRDTVDEHLAELFPQLDSVRRALDVGCGTGTHTLWLAAQGVETVGVDIAPRAVEMAKEKAGNVTAQFYVADLAAAPLDDQPFDFAFDRGCFHTINAERRETYVNHLAAALRDGGDYLLLAGNADEVRGPDCVAGPPQLAARTIAAAIEPKFEILDLRRIHFTDDGKPSHMAWRLHSRKRASP